ncbi:MAG: hypothetical protein PVI79_06020 [Gammaproteobacteria bacterium]
MRYSILLICLLLAACGTKSSHEDAAPPIVRHGLIAAKKDVSMDQVESNTTRGTTSVYGSISSGGGVSIGIGIGVLLGSIGSGGSDPKPVRYDIDLQDGGQITIYHESRDFAVGDCVEITVYPDEKEHPPTMRRNPGGC